MKPGEKKTTKLAEKCIRKQNMKFTSNETLNFFLQKVLFYYILDLAKTAWSLQILSQKFTRILWRKKFSFSLEKDFKDFTFHFHIYISRSKKDSKFPCSDFFHFCTCQIINCTFTLVVSYADNYFEQETSVAAADVFC